jgi:hypothetical protein
MAWASCLRSKEMKAVRFREIEVSREEPDELAQHLFDLMGQAQKTNASDSKVYFHHSEDPSRTISKITMSLMLYYK